MYYFSLLVLLGLTFLTSGCPEEEDAWETTQTLELPASPPSTVTVDTQRLVYRVSGLSPVGLLSQQVRTALRALMQRDRNARIVKLRAFVAGSGDPRRVQAVVSEVFSERKLPLPTLTIVQTGALPVPGAQVVLEATSVAREPQNPHGLAFISGQAAISDRPLTAVAPLAQQSVDRVRTLLREEGLESKDVLRATCYLSSMEDIQAVRQVVGAEFPAAALNYVQFQRAPLQPCVTCEVVARMRSDIGQPVRLRSPVASAGAEGRSQLAIVAAPQVVISGSQLCFGLTEDDARLAFERLEKSLNEAGSSLKRAAVVNTYTLSLSIGNLAKGVQTDFYDKTRPPAGSLLSFEGLPSLDASFAIDGIAVLSAKE